MATLLHFNSVAIQQQFPVRLKLRGEGFCSDDETTAAAAVVDGSTRGYGGGGGDVCVSALAHGKIIFVVEIEWALSVPIRFGQIGVVGSDNVGLRHVAPFLLREGEAICGIVPVEWGVRGWDVAIFWG